MKYGEIVHFSHPHHTLRLEYHETPFKCDGCREVGIGSRFKCSTCDYDLHKQCALSASNPSIRHAFYPKCIFQFLSRPPGNAARYCNACEKDVTGFVYHCYRCGFDLHPCCASLPHVLEANEGLCLYLYRKVSSSCHRCGRKGRSWSYRSSCKNYNLHVACVTEMLVESWHEIYYKNNHGHNNGNISNTKRGIGSGISNNSVGIYGMSSNGYKVPSIVGAGKNHHHHRSRKGKVKRCCEVAALAVQVVISAVLGDPTAIIAGVIGSFISR
ncbi:hypothetical protein LUZ61_014625 [Rhynchospora tenuis]|uniref:Phorbol-ester/DAG-type domain-containing protein n=1 Tax=Rhynchospora tenuis TaxID=198213 RepID=A0AAD5Z3B4_9POAL|nr:hypothetical protein LUZ61_014625 [Rhynchospora tenuis]